MHDKGGVDERPVHHKSSLGFMGGVAGPGRVEAQMRRDRSLHAAWIAHTLAAARLQAFTLPLAARSLRLTAWPVMLAASKLTPPIRAAAA